MSHPDPNGPPDLTPIHEGEVLENPVTRERATILELPFSNAEERATAELTALVGARVVGEHLHPAIVERFTVLEGEPCGECGGTVVKMVVAGRGTYVCEKCQPRPRTRRTRRSGSPTQV